MHNYKIQTFFLFLVNVSFLQISLRSFFKKNCGEIKLKILKNIFRSYHFSCMIICFSDCHHFYRSCSFVVFYCFAPSDHLSMYFNILMGNNFILPNYIIKKVFGFISYGTNRHRNKNLDLHLNYICLF